MHHYLFKQQDSKYTPMSPMPCKFLEKVNTNGSVYSYGWKYVCSATALQYCFFFQKHCTNFFFHYCRFYFTTDIRKLIQLSGSACNSSLWKRCLHFTLLFMQTCCSKIHFPLLKFVLNQLWVNKYIRGYFCCQVLQGPKNTTFPMAIIHVGASKRECNKLEDFAAALRQ